MGGAIGSMAKSVGSGLGSVVGGVGDFMTKPAGMVKGTGQTVGELKNIGYTNDELASLGGGEPSGAQNAMRGIFGAVGGGLKNYPQRQQPSGSAPPIEVTPTPAIATGYDPNYLANYLRQNPYATSAFGR